MYQQKNVGYKKYHSYLKNQEYLNSKETGEVIGYPETAIKFFCNKENFYSVYNYLEVMAKMKEKNLLTTQEGIKILALCTYNPAPNLKGIHDAIIDSSSTYLILTELRKKTLTVKK